jgi:hypothetical protein
VNATERKRGGLYFYLAVIFSVVVFAYSAFLILDSITKYGAERPESFYYSLVLGLIGVGLAVSSLTTMRRRIQIIKTQNLKTFTVELCEKCGFKKVREFKVGDYVQKKIGACQQCSSDLLVNAIYSESPKQ